MEFIQLLKRLHDGCVELARPLRIEAGQRVAACVYVRIVELAGAFHALAAANLWVGPPLVLRSMLESFADLRNLLRDPNYQKRMEVTVAEQWLRLIESAREEPANPYLEGVREADQERDLLAHFQDRVRELGAEGAVSLRPWQRLQVAGLLHEKVAIYGRLCSETHGDLSSLLRRHIVEESGLPRVQLYGRVDGAEFLPLIDTAAAILLSATSEVHSALGEGQPARVKALVAELNSVRERHSG
jgi:hypothetical protein